ncbi:MAG: hypothetical protein ACOX4B_05805 [Bacillota bacterium]|jgi:hypothetical protein|nr:hypothetical protein [Candidatus Fermentithermobacillaceae bacterium]
MKPLDALTSLPRSPDVARYASTLVRQGEAQAQSQMLGFAKELSHKNQTVGETTKTWTDNKTDTDSPGGGGTFYEANPERRGGRDEREEPSTLHPSKGKILDIKGI